MAPQEREIASPLASDSGFGAVKDLEHELARAFPQAELYGAILDAQLRRTIHRVVDEAKAQGKSAQEVVTTIKDVARRAGFARPDAVRPVSSFPADRLLTKAITACIEMYHETDDAPPSVPSRVAEQSHTPRFDPNELFAIANATDSVPRVPETFRTILTRENEGAFTHAIAQYVRSSHARGVDIEQVLAGVNRILAATDDMTRPADDHLSRSRQLVLRGLLLAFYGAGIVDGDAVRDGHRADRPASQLPPTRDLGVA